MNFHMFTFKVEFCLLIHSSLFPFLSRPEEIKQTSLDDRELLLDFETVPLASCPRTTLVLTNTSAIRARFDLELDHFRGRKPPTPPDGKKLEKYAGRVSNRRHLLQEKYEDHNYIQTINLV